MWTDVAGNEPLLSQRTCSPAKAAGGVLLRVILHFPDKHPKHLMETCPRARAMAGAGAVGPGDGQ